MLRRSFGTGRRLAFTDDRVQRLMSLTQKGLRDGEAQQGRQRAAESEPAKPAPRTTHVALHGVAPLRSKSTAGKSTYAAAAAAAAVAAPATAPAPAPAPPPPQPTPPPPPAVRPMFNLEEIAQSKTAEMRKTGPSVPSGISSSFNSNSSSRTHTGAIMPERYSTISTALPRALQIALEQDEIAFNECLQHWPGSWIPFSNIVRFDRYEALNLPSKELMQPTERTRAMHKTVPRPARGQQSEPLLPTIPDLWTNNNSFLLKLKYPVGFFDWIKEFEKKLPSPFHDKTLLLRAFVHESAVQDRYRNSLQHQSRERLAFVGDAILNTVITVDIMKTFSQLNLANWTKRREAVRSNVFLGDIGEEWRVPQNLVQTRSPMEFKKDVADAMEAVIGAIFFDQGYIKACDYLERTLIPRLNALYENGGLGPKHYLNSDQSSL